MWPPSAMSFLVPILKNLQWFDQFRESIILRGTLEVELSTNSSYIFRAILKRAFFFLPSYFSPQSSNSLEAFSKKQVHWLIWTENLNCRTLSDGFSLFFLFLISAMWKSKTDHLELTRYQVKGCHERHAVFMFYNLWGFNLSVMVLLQIWKELGQIS